SSTRDLSMSDARILEKGLRRSRRAGYSGGGARSDHEDLGKGLGSPAPRLPSVSFPVPEKLNDFFVILPLHEASGDRRQERLLKKRGKLPHRLLPAALMSL